MKFFHVCLVVLLAFRMSEAAAQNMDTDSERARKVWTEHFRDDENLRNDLLGEFTATDGADWEGIDKLTRCYSVSEDRLRSAAMSLFEEATNLSSDGASHKDGVPLRLLANNALFLLGKYADNTTKSFLLSLAADKSKDGILRTVALSSYLHAADAEEAKGVLLRFLAGDYLGIDPLSVYSNAAEVYDHTPLEDGAKRRAIIAALMVAAAREEGKIGFVEVDRILAMRSDTYRRSHERLAMLEHHSLEPPTKNLYTDADLKAALAESRNYRSHTSVNTNAAMLQAIDFNEERPADDAETWGGKLVIPSQEAMLVPRGVQPETAEPQVRSGRWRTASLGGLAVVVTAFVLFILHRRAGDKCPSRKTK